LTFPLLQQGDFDASIPTLQPRLEQLCGFSFPAPFGPSPSVHHAVRWLPVAPSIWHQTPYMVQTYHEVLLEPQQSGTLFFRGRYKSCCALDQRPKDDLDLFETWVGRQRERVTLHRCVTHELLKHDRICWSLDGRRDRI
jgi:hypothetical protein